MTAPQSFVAAQHGLRQLFVLCALIIFTVLTGATDAEAAAKRAYAGIVVDAKTGKTLYSQAADAQRYPASVTKVMTLYVLFQELEAGNLTLNTKMTVSRHAANAVPTKLGLRAGSSIRVEDAIKSLVTLSANDMARVIAEHISGSESAFAVRMTKTAKALGMNNTTYRNASGLPDSGQVTTVRDQARLAVAIYQHFPKYYEYFQTRSFKYGKASYGNHNRLLGQNGVDGIKTGYINASGYNLMTAARKDDRHIVVIAFGFDSGSSRNSKVASLVKQYLPKARRGDYFSQAIIAKTGAGATYRSNIQVASAPVPMMPPSGRLAPPAPLPLAEAPAQVAAVMQASVPAPEQRPINLVPANAAQATQLVANAGQPVPATRPAANDIIGAWIGENLRLGPETAANGAPLPPAPIQSGAQPASGQTIDLLTSGGVKQADAIGSWVVQIGAAPSEDGARRLLASAMDSKAELTDYRPLVETTEKNGQTFYRARFAGFGDRNQARKMCDQLMKKKMSCLAVQG